MGYILAPLRGLGRKPCRSKLLVLVCLATLTAPLFAQSWRIADFQDTILISEDGSALVKERISLVFIGQWHGIHRTIPVEYPGPRGTNYTLFLDVTAVTDGAGQKLKYESKTSGGYRDLKIYIPDAVDTTRTVEISYIVRNGIRYFEDHDEFYWNVTGNDWPVPIDHAEAHVYLPKKAAGSATGAGLYRRLRIGPARCHFRGQRRRRGLRDHQPAAHARRNDD